LSGCLLATLASATETTTYHYDAQGRLIKTSKAGGPAAGEEKCTAYDPAGNRTSRSIGTGGCTAGGGGPGGGGNPPISFAINNPSAKLEGSTIVFTVTKTGSGAASVNYATANVDAIAGSDYAAKSGTLSFAANDTSKTISVVTYSDSLFESTETFRVNLSNPTGGATISTAQGTGLIMNNGSSGCNPICQ
jgi:YD repeat-containing protein